MTCYCESFSPCVGSRLQQWNAPLSTGVELTFRPRIDDEIIEWGN